MFISTEGYKKYRKDLKSTRQELENVTGTFLKVDYCLYGSEMLGVFAVQELLAVSESRIPEDMKHALLKIARRVFETDTRAMAQSLRTLLELIPDNNGVERHKRCWTSQ